MKFWKNFVKKNKDKWWFKYPKKLLNFLLFSGLPFFIGLYLGNEIVCIHHYFAGNYIIFHLTDYSISIEGLDEWLECPEIEEFSVFVENKWYGQNRFKYELSTNPHDNEFNFTVMCQNQLEKFENCNNEITVNGNSDKELLVKFNTGKCKINNAKICFKIIDVPDSRNYEEACKDVVFKN